METADKSAEEISKMGDPPDNTDPSWTYSTMNGEFYGVSETLPLGFAPKPTASTGVLQTELINVLGIDDLLIDGWYTDATEEAVKALQEKYNLTATGVFDTATLYQLEMELDNTSNELIYQDNRSIGDIFSGGYKPVSTVIEEDDKVKVEYHDNYDLENEDFWKPAIPMITNKEGERSAEAYNLVIDQFNVSNNKRYEQRDVTGDGKDNTFCNVFAIDVLDAMGVNVDRGRANTIANWFEEKGQDNGWTEVSAEEAQNYANQGLPTVAVWENPNPDDSGHIAIVRPYDPTMGLDSSGIYIAQAGSKNFNYDEVSIGFGSNKVNDIKYYYHQ